MTRPFTAHPAWVLPTLPSDADIRPLPGTRPCPPEDWLRVDAVHGAQMALRDRLVAQRPGDVLASCAGAGDAAEELLGLVLEAQLAREDHVRINGDLVRADGVRVPVSGPPLAALARIAQEDFCILLPSANGYHLAAAALCFPASWTLSQKLGRSLGPIHAPVAAYDDTMARRVQRLFDGLRTDLFLVRWNRLDYATSDLFHPRAEDAAKPRPGGSPRYWRAERQVLRRLPGTGAIAFSIHTYVAPAGPAPADQ